LSDLPLRPAKDDAPYSSRRLMVRLWHGYLRRHIPMMSIAMGLMVIEGSTLGFLSYMLKPLFDQVFVGNDMQAVGWVGGVILGLFLVRAVSLMFSRTLLTRIAMQSSTDMQVDLVRHLLTLDNRFFQQNPPGSLIERVQGDTVAVQAVWRTVVTGASRDLVSLGSLLVVALLVDPQAVRRVNPIGDALLAVADELGDLGELHRGPRGIMSLGSIVHFHTPIEVELAQQVGITSLIRRLHPTPALGPLPRTEETMAKLIEWRNRLGTPAEFGTPFGAVVDGEFQAIVAIRGIWWNGSEVRLPAGCGVIEASRLVNEWRELRLKREAVKARFGL
jgi:ABC-type multidrug transport system fused ATPase/permease subunit